MGLPVAHASSPGSPACQCRAAILIDAQNAQVLWEYHAFRQMDPASITKMMTAYLVIRAGHLDRRVSISRLAASTPGSRMHLARGQEYTILDLLRGLLLRSGNDASVALAEAEAGSVPGFVARMNRAARSLGAFNTHFSNPNGLTAPGHYSSAYDLALIARAALELPLFQHLVSTREDSVTELTRGRRRDFYNTNRLLETFPHADGIKTGTTNAAGKCLAASATRDGVQLIAIVLHSEDRWGDAARLLNWGFHTWTRRTLARAGQPLAKILVRGGTVPAVVAVASRSLSVLVPRTEAPELLVAAERRVLAPVPQGAWLGNAYAMVAGQPIAAWPLQAAAPVGRSYSPRSLWQRLVDWLFQGS
jgi:D-alanyl-D-alanine carboxypeptidase (penicillin-binding protein 5/6)